MSLVHSFYIIDNKEKISQVDVPDYLIYYFKDSLLWIKTMWNNEKYENGLPYYGYSLIIGEEIDRLKKIMMNWRNLFSLGSDTIILTGSFLLEDKQYEKITNDKVSILRCIDQLIELCSYAEKMQKNILYEGI